MQSSHSRSRHGRWVALHKHPVFLNVSHGPMTPGTFFLPFVNSLVFFESFFSLAMDDEDFHFSYEMVSSCLEPFLLCVSICLFSRSTVWCGDGFLFGTCFR